MSENSRVGFIIGLALVVAVLFVVANAFRPQVEGSIGDLLSFIEIVGVVGIITMIIIAFILYRDNLN